MTAYAVVVEDELAHGITPAAIARDLGIKTSSVAKALDREGRPDLSHVFYRADYHARDHHTKRCLDCSTPVFRGPRCLPCGVAHRDATRRAA
ncbi:MAG: hypothetical protein HOV66_07880 [Streptomycetaceae bacterium]|nr:hypothetical protein [Streptomycetaceae bacterium]NUS54768.1 hypothetical protein [Streptomycetaceae bacterium]